MNRRKITRSTNRHRDTQVLTEKPYKNRKSETIINNQKTFKVKKRPRVNNIRQ